jgi:alkylated DNA repair dioxygenase AlkB
MNETMGHMSWAQHDLGDGCLFQEGRLPDGLVWGEDEMETVWAACPTERHRIRIGPREYQCARWTQAYGADYAFSGAVSKAQPLPDWIKPLLAWARSAVDERLNGALLNWYKGQDQIGEHHDEEKDLFDGSAIVTVSFGEERLFRLSRGKGEQRRVLDFPALHGTVFVMPWATNLAWKHGVPKFARYRGQRVSVTFRAFERGALP